MVGIILDTLGVAEYEPVNIQDPVQNLIPGCISLYPNPARSTVSLQFELKQSQPVRMEIFNLRGQLVHSSSETAKAGIQNFKWNLRDNNGKVVGSGIYLCKLSTGSQTRSAKLVVLH